MQSFFSNVVKNVVSSLEKLVCNKFCANNINGSISAVIYREYSSLVSVTETVKDILVYIAFTCLLLTTIVYLISFVVSVLYNAAITIISATRVDFQ